MQNGYHPKDLFDPVEELRQARAANGGKWVDEHTKTEAVLDTALQVHDKDSANLEDSADVSARAVLAAAFHCHCSCLSLMTVLPACTSECAQKCWDPLPETAFRVHFSHSAMMSEPT